MITELKTKDAPPAIGPYSQAIQAGSFVFLSGQIPLNPHSGKVEETSIEGQTNQVLANIEAILKEASLGFQNVVRVEIYLKDIKDFAIVNQIYQTKFSHPIKPARQTMQVGALPLDVRIEISCIAFVG